MSEKEKGEPVLTVTLTITEYEETVTVQSTVEPRVEEGPFDEAPVGAQIGHVAGQAALHAVRLGPRFAKRVVDHMPTFYHVDKAFDALSAHDATEPQEGDEEPPK